MFNLKKLLSNPKLTEILALLFYLSVSIFSGFYLVKSCINNESILRTIALLLGFLLFITNTVFKWGKLTNPNLSDETNNQPKNKLFSKQWYSENLGAIITMIMGMSVLLILLIILIVNGDWNKTYTVSDPKFEILNYWSIILFEFGWLLDSLKKFPKLQKILDNQLSSLLSTITVLSAFIMYMIYAVHITEVP